jgi:hypothetical protein
MPDAGLMMPQISEAVAAHTGIVDFSFAGIKWRLRNHCSGLDVATDPRTLAFICDNDDAPDATVDVTWSNDFGSPGDVIFDAGLWRAYSGDALTFHFHTDKLGPQPYKRATFNRDLTCGEVLLNRDLLRNETSYYPFEYPLDELAMMHRLALGHGVELHSCGLATDDGRGYLFVGHSGAGKSTIGKLLVSERNARILSDDRVIVTRDNSFRIHGTPWHGEAGLACNASAELKAIFLIQHGSQNELLPVNPVQASAELFARSFVPWYRPECLSFSLGFMQSIVTHVPVFILRFVPDANVIDFLETNGAI